MDASSMKCGGGHHDEFLNSNHLDLAKEPVTVKLNRHSLYFSFKI